MKNNIIIANWKMSLGQKQSLDLIESLIKKINSQEKNLPEVVICPSFNVMAEVAQKISKTEIKLGAQDCFWEEQGAYTGEVSAKVLKEIGCEFVIVGHSERRNYVAETDAMVNRKIRAMLKNKLTPILCVGEKFEERQSGDKDYIIMQQVQKGLEGIKFNKDDRLIVAYEPVWVIGSGQAVAPEEAEHTNRVIRQVLLDHLPLEIVKNQVHLIYGGSVNLENIKGFLDEPNIDGYLIGGASLEADEFWSLIKAMK
jgi:triosephosphate isomerase (TIM)